MPRYHIAFLTPEFPTERIKSRGGLSNYLNRCTQAMTELGHRVEVFVRSEADEEPIDHHGVQVHRVLPKPHRVPKPYRWLGRWGPLTPYTTAHCLATAAALAERFHQVHAQQPFDLVQSSDYNIPGIFVPPQAALRHVVRCSLSRSWLEAARPQKWGIGRIHDRKLLKRLEQQLFHSVTRVYAPSEYTAGQYSRHFGVEVGVVRPPFFHEISTTDGPLPDSLPPRFLLFVGHLNQAKGIDILAKALPQAWRQEPELRMVWAGVGDYDTYRRQFGPFEDRVMHLGAVEKSSVYALMRRAEAVVAPSRVDNLPNVVLEAVSVGTPVIGTAGASIDEIVEPGRSGLLFPLGDTEALAEAMVRVWQGEGATIRQNFTPPAILEEMQPALATANLLRFAGLAV